MTIELIQITANIVSAQIRATPVALDELPALIDAVHRKVCSLSTEDMQLDKPTSMPQEALEDGLINPENWPGVYDDKIVCLEDGKSVVLIKPHVERNFGMSIEEYKRRWKLPADYPTSPPQYRKNKREKAKETGLGVTIRSIKPNEPEKDLQENKALTEAS